MLLTQTARYEEFGLDGAAQQRLALLGDLILGAGFNVTSLKEPQEVERLHFLDSLSLLALPAVLQARRIVDIGSGAGLPALVLAIALPAIALPARVTALESQQKKCRFIADAAERLGLQRVEVVCARAEEFGQGAGRGAFDLAVSRALAPLPVVAEYSLPLLEDGGMMLAMKGAISNQEWRQAENALGILGAGRLESVRLAPFPEAENHWVYMAQKVGTTSGEYPRRPGIPAKRPLGA